jgi:hypothetical protein
MNKEKFQCFANRVLKEQHLTDYNVVIQEDDVGDLGYVNFGDDGVFEKTIYIDTQLSDEKMKEVLLHEIAHIKTGQVQDEIYHNKQFQQIYKQLTKQYGIEADMAGVFIGRAKDLFNSFTPQEKEIALNCYPPDVFVPPYRHKDGTRVRGYCKRKTH